MHGFSLVLALLCAARAAAAPSFLELGLDRRGPTPADAALEALSIMPPPVLLELRALYTRYAEVVHSKREADGWKAGLETGAHVQRSDAGLLPGRQAHDAHRLRRAELRALEERRAAMTSQFSQAAREDLRLEIDRKKRAVRAARRLAERTMGLALDWSDLVWAEMIKLEPEHWSVADAARDAHPRHTAAVLCTPAEDPALCLAFDPWPRGEPDVYEYETWAKGDWSGRMPAEFFLHHLPESRKS